MKFLKALLLIIYCYVMLRGLVPLYAVGIIAVCFIPIVFTSHSHSGFDIDYMAYNSAFYDLNPAIKTIFFIVALVLCVALKNVYVSLFIAVSMVFITVVIGKIPFHHYKQLITVPLYFIILSTLTMAIELKGGIHISQEGQINGMKLFLTAMASVTCLYGLALSTPVSDLIEVFNKIKIPSLIIELMFLIYRFIFVLSDIVSNMKKSVKVRNGFNTYRNTVTSYGHIAKNLLIYSMKKSNDYYDAMTARGYNGKLAFYCEYERIKIKDIVFCVLYFIIIGAICLV